LSAGLFFEVLPQVEEVDVPGKSMTLGPLSHGGETVLLVEDEESVRALGRMVLQMQGYTVLEADNGAAALEIAARHKGPIDLLLSDVVMPALGGRQLAERLLQNHPKMKVLFQSGYTSETVVRTSVEKVNFLQKPYSPAALADKVREVLDAPA
jgi:two-component system, cell cycle sensor histidine kinase and response regulator CckA